MTRLHCEFACEGEQLVGTLDTAARSSGLLLVTGGNETRAGAFSGQAHLAARIAAAGFPVFRFDRRGVGDSCGANRGFRSSSPDLAAALAAFRRACPGVTRVIGFGNCDAASALMLAGGAGFDALVLSNPWIFDDAHESATTPAAARARYAEKLRNPSEVLRLFKGQVSFSKLAGGIGRALRPSPPPSGLLSEMRGALTSFAGPVHFLIAGRDRTGLAFQESWGADERIATCVGADHAYSGSQSSDWLFNQLIDILDKKTS